MAEWKNFNINKNQVETETARGVLIKMPNSSRYAGFKFWHPRKCVREGRHSAALSVGYTDEFTFRLERRSPKTFEVLATEVLDAEDLVAEFEQTDNGISSPSFKPSVKTRKAEAIDIDSIDATVPEDLIND